MFDTEERRSDLARIKELEEALEFVSTMLPQNKGKDVIDRVLHRRSNMIETMVSSELFERLVGDTTLTFEQAILNLEVKLARAEQLNQDASVAHSLLAEKIAEERTKQVRMEKALRRLTYCNEAVLQYGETYRPDLDKAIEVAKEILA